MTPDQVKIVQESFAKVAPISDQAATIFYDRLFEVAPSVKAMFPADMTEQRKKLMATLAVVVNGLSNLESVLPAASALAIRHVAYGAKAEHFRWSAAPCCGRWRRDWARPGRARWRPPGPRPMAPCPPT
jgi:nitric oxide dioxygenase